MIFIPTIAVGQAIKRRSDCFFGLHFDFHATINDNQIGATLSPQMVDVFLDQIKPDFIQVDSKGHPGISSYPTQIGISAGIVKDPLKIFRKETASRGVGLFAHFSGVVDMEAIKNHPDWARVNFDGAHDLSSTSIFGNYCDSYFIPQLKELIRNYGIDGVWIDGECWGVQADFSVPAKRAFLKATGQIATLDTAYMYFTRNAFHKYLAHYTDVLHSYNPKLQIASNWAFSSYMPGKIDAHVDFLSGDIVHDDTQTVEFEARVMADEHKPWDLMIWGFMGDKDGRGHYWKSARMLKQKGALIISQGGAYQIYMSQNRDASLPLNTVPMLKEVAAFCRARKPYCFKSKNVPQIAVLFSESGHNYDLGTSTAFNQDNGGNDNIKGAISMLLNSHYSVQIVQEADLSQDINDYPLLVISEWNYLAPAVLKNIENYAFKGGKVLIIGAVSCNLFSNILSTEPETAVGSPYSLSINKKTFGKGVIIGVNANISLNYLNVPDEKIRSTIANMVEILFPNPILSVTGSDKIHLSVSRGKNASYIHVINVGDSWNILNNNQMSYELPAINKVDLIYTSNVRPKQVLLQPEGIPLKFTYANKKVIFTIPKVDIYSIIELKL